MAAGGAATPLPMDDATLAQLGTILNNTLSGDGATRKQAEQSLLEQVAPRPGYCVALLKILQLGTFPAGVQQQAAIQFKNFVAKRWDLEQGDSQAIQDSDKGTVKQYLIDLMALLPRLLRSQLGEAVGIIANKDFPDAWPTLCTELVAKIDTGNMDVTNGILDAAAAAFRRFDGAYDSDAVRWPLSKALEGFQLPLTQLYQKLMQEIGAMAGDKAALTARFTALSTCTRIFYCLNYIELPQFFLENLATWVGMFQTFLSYSNAVLEDPDETDVAGPVETLQTHIMAALALYAEKFDEDVEEHLPVFVDSTWKLLQAASTGSVASLPKYDGMVTQAVKFLSCVVAKAAQSQLFASEATLTALCQSAVLPNMALREGDEEVFEDTPAQYVTRNIEGSDSETRRHAAGTLVKGLLVKFEAPVTAICNKLVDGLMAEYNRAPEARWREKEAALALLTALAAKGRNTARGGGELNSHVDIMAVLKTYVVPELHLSGAAAGQITGALPTGTAILKCTCLNFITAFRQHWPAAVIAELAGMVTQWLKSPMFVLHSYAAVTLERLLSVVDHPQAAAGGGAKGPGVRRITPAVVTTLLNPALSAALQRVASVGQAAGAAKPSEAGVLGRQDGNGENEWMMRLVLRLLVVAGSGAAAVLGDVLGVLVKVATAVAGNPAAPHFNHNLFESLAMVIKIAVSVHAADPAKVGAAVGELEGALMPLFNMILSKDVTEFVPYVFQLLASLLAHKPKPAPGTHALSPGMQALSLSLTQASLWERSSNAPALTMLVASILAKGSAHILEKKQLLPILGVYQKLLASARTEDLAHTLLRAVIVNVPLEAWQDQAPTALSFILQRMQRTTSKKTANAFVVTMCLLALTAGGTAAVAVVEAIQPGLFTQVLSTVLLPHANSIVSQHDRRTVVAGMAALAGEVEALLTPAALPQWRALATTGVQLQEAAGDTQASAAHADAARVNARAEMAGEVAHFDTKFARLSHVVIPGGSGRGGTEYVPAGQDLRALWAGKLKAVVEKVGVGAWGTLTQGMDAAVVGVMKTYLASVQVAV